MNFNKAWDKDKKKDNDKDKGLGNRICIKISNCLLFTLVNQHKLLDPNVQLIWFLDTAHLISLHLLGIWILKNVKIPSEMEVAPGYNC